MRISDWSSDVCSSDLRSIEGLEQAEIIVPGYAVEYDHIDPRALASSMLVRGMTGLYCAGQINGTTGYAAAASQGLVVGINVAAFALAGPKSVVEGMGGSGRVGVGARRVV